jgi:hypothetical protein
VTPWLAEVAELIHAGRRGEAVALTRSRADAGELAAQVRLARFGEEAGVPRPDADAIVEHAERNVLSGDADAQWVLYGAYEEGLGSCEYEEKARRAFRHLRAYAELTNDPQAT